ncbi:MULTISPECIES: DUF4394 domain-containing protein [unclassified Roseateles]|uniref:DUF4394 domain-containing protein n=1 Tax=unclassified Roseateles TaxID=2626991 RepID=UPI0006F8675E|nr:MULTISPECIES: DUF4394 domain-containing protein [unclassified Roseateles]KQW52044.1 hypothetical protein ASC81_05460 [Pelomonas sp. Root405]KRA78278.1 hypothetical protein ASD88_05465 [Pelomonas sp. Root662]
MNTFSFKRASLAALTLASLAACSTMTPEPEGAVRDEKAVAVTASNKLLKFNAGRPGRILATLNITGLQAGETLLGIDYRVSKEQLYALGSTGRLYVLDDETGAASIVGSPFSVKLEGAQFGFDFNPAVDRIRVVSNTGQNLRLHPDTGAVVDGNATLDGVQTDGKLAYAAGDSNAGKSPIVVGAAYSYNKADPKITTNFALDAATGALVTQGSREGVAPAVSPNTGQLMTIGALGAAFSSAAFDIQALSDVAFAALNSDGTTGSRWVTIDLKTGAAKSLGTIGGGERVVGIALEP